MTDAIEGKTVTTDLDAGTQTVSDVSEVSPPNTKKTKRILNPVTLKVIERSIQEVLSDYVKESKQFTADSMHGIRVKVTEMVKQRLGEDEIENVDIGLDLAKVPEIPFFFKVNIPTSKQANHFIEVNEDGFVVPTEEPVSVPRCGEAQTPEEFKKLVEGDGK